MHPRHPQPRRARAGGRTRPCDERFVPPLLSHPGGWKGKAAALGHGTNPSHCCKSALGVCPALQTLGVRAVPSPLWVATVWRSEPRNRVSEPGRTRTGALRRDWGQQCWHTQHQGQSWSLVPLAPLNPLHVTLIGVWVQGGKHRQNCPVFEVTILICSMGSPSHWSPWHSRVYSESLFLWCLSTNTSASWRVCGSFLR